MDSYGSRNNSNKYQKPSFNRRSHDDDMYSERDRNDDYYNKKSKKPEQNYYQAKQQQQQQQQQIQGSKSDSSKRYESRQGSEPRIMSNSNSNFSYNQDPDKNNYDRNRGNDQKVGMNQQSYEHRNKPPSIPRINNAGFKNLPLNIDTLPPRLKRKFLKDCGLPEELADKPLFEFAQQSSGYSSTLPFGNRNRYDQQHRPQNFQNNNYQSKYNNQNSNYNHYNNDRGNDRGNNSNNHHRSRSITPPRQQPQKQHYTPKNEWKSPNEKQQQQQQQQHYEDVIRKTDKEGQSSFDWSEDVMANSLSLPPDVNNASSRDHKYDDNNRHRHRRRRNRSASSNGSAERSGGYNPNDNNFQNVFKMPFPKPGNNRQRKNSQSSYNSRENSMERSYGYNSRDNSLDRRQNHGRRYQNRRGSDNYHSSRENSAERYGTTNWSRQGSSSNLQDEAISWRRADEAQHMSSKTDQKIAELTKQFETSVELNKSSNNNNIHNNNQGDQRVLFDPNNPSKPIVVKQSQSRPREFLVPDVNEHFNDHQNDLSAAKPVWLKKSSEQYQKSIKSKRLIDELDVLDCKLNQLIDNSDLIQEWTHIQELRESVQLIFEELLRVDMRFCQIEHVEHYFWKLLFYRIIELLRKKMQDCDDESRGIYKEKAIEIVDTGTKYLEALLIHLEACHKFQIEDYIGDNAANFKSGLGYVGLALVSSQKIFLFLGDLARYREQINTTNNFGRAKNYYVKAQQIVPKNGRPFNQLALLAVYSKRKIDAVYFYMRSLMSSNPFLAAKESLVALFDEIRKKYEFSQRKREEKTRLRLKEKEHRFDGNLRKETWIHPEGGSRVHRTAPLDVSMISKNTDSSDDELDQMDPSELNKRFIISFLHVQGKLITKIGMETFHTCATQMLREFRALLHISPIPINSHRLLQLISLNMYAIECNALNCTELKDSSIGADMQARPEVQECAIIVALLMFGIIVERFIEMLRESLNGGSKTSAVVILSGEDQRKVDKTNITTKDESKKILKLNEDSKVLLPAIKVWTDWMFYHENVWNPPPYSDYKISAMSNHDPWNGLATLMTLLETVVDANKDYLVLGKDEDNTLVRLLEDITLAGFTPLKKVTQDPIYCKNDINIEIAQNSLRLQKLMFFGTDFLCKCNPQPILKKIISPSNGKVEYMSIVQNRTGSASGDSEILLESFSDEEENSSNNNNNSNNNNKKYVDIVNDEQKNSSSELDDNLMKSPDLKSHHDAAEIRRLLRRKDELERKQRMHEKYNERLQDILSNSVVAVWLEVRPRYLIPDTNCFIDDLELIKAIANAHPLYQLMIPIVVINELEGLSRGIVKPLTSSVVMTSALCEKLEKNSMHNNNNIKSGSRSDPQHVAMVTQACKNALTFLKLKSPAVKCVTTKGSIINAAIFTSEDSQNEQKSNDDKILDTALSLCKKNVEQKQGDVRYIIREVVLLSSDRNLRVKALTNDIPVRELPDFVRWAGLSSDL
ncbi:hypothetical protein ACKWTF_005254 [Chironomus riparius]